MSLVDLILKKRDGNELTDGEIGDFVRAVKDKTMADYQISAMLMAIYFRGMSPREIATFTREMALSGETLTFPSIKDPIVDKHSSGGVGDKTSLVISPIVAACGLPIAKLSGRGLGFTGGTIDKLESIPGFRTELTSEEFTHFVEKDGIAIMGQSASIAPVDKLLYALRDVTGTVDSIPLIAGSIMSKKLADGSDAIVLDVKYGSGAFMKTTDQAVELAKVMVGIGEDNGKNTMALVTNMDQPLGSAVGNNLEVMEAVEALHGQGPEDFLLECRAIASAMLELGGKSEEPDEAEKMVREVIDSGAAFEKFKTMVKNQGGDVSFVEDPSLFPQASFVLEGHSEKGGYIAAINTEEIGKASLLLGAGRVRLEDQIDPSVGIRVFKKIGDRVREGDLLFTVHANDRTRGEAGLKKALQAYEIADHPVKGVDHPVFCRVKRQGGEEVEERVL
ncbi:thymidine phosphorylase [Kallipyga massiliensis]|uniref:thymidine phosphorylase n=1 Tax=Kallipyga massiliensis TaxID=1472764 RepID=UPI0004B8F674|nr:thymidine phosphorylase [Kallipyga massiliensis]